MDARMRQGETSGHGGGVYAMQVYGRARPLAMDAKPVAHRHGKRKGKYISFLLAY